MKKLLTILTALTFLLSGCAGLSPIGSEIETDLCDDRLLIRKLQYSDFARINFVNKTMEFDILDVIERHHKKRLDEMQVSSMIVKFTYASRGICEIVHVETRSLYGASTRTITLPYLPDTYFYWEWHFKYRG